jgi:hypothetical protein
MAQQAPRSSLSLRVLNKSNFARLLLLHGTMSTTAMPQTPQQQYVYSSVPVTTATSQVAAYAKNSQNGTLSGVVGAPFADSLQGGAMAIDGLGHFLFVINPSTSNISMLQINQSTGSLTEVPGSPFSTGPTKNPAMAPTSPACIATEKSGQFLYVGYRFGNFVGQGAINEYLIDAVNRQLVPLPGQRTTDIPSAPIGLVSDPKGVFAGRLYRDSCPGASRIPWLRAKLDSPCIARRGTGGPGVRLSVRGSGMWWGRGKRGATEYPVGASGRYTAGNVDDYGDPVGDDVNRHATVRHTTSSANPHGAIGRTPILVAVFSDPRKYGKSPRRRRPIPTRSHPAQRPRQPAVRKPCRKQHQAQARS